MADRVSDERLAAIIDVANPKYSTGVHVPFSETQYMARELQERRRADQSPHQELYEEGRCQVCGWPLEKSLKDGCTAQSCSYRPREGSSEWFAIKERREWLASLPVAPEEGSEP